MSCAESADCQKQHRTEFVFKTSTSRTIQHQPDFHWSLRPCNLQQTLNKFISADWINFLLRHLKKAENNPTAMWLRRWPHLAYLVKKRPSLWTCAHFTKAGMLRLEAALKFLIPSCLHSSLSATMTSGCRPIWNLHQSMEQIIRKWSIVQKQQLESQ